MTRRAKPAAPPIAAPDADAPPRLTLWERMQTKLARDAAATSEPPPRDGAPPAHQAPARTFHPDGTA
jgi:hypothetical protein